MSLFLEVDDVNKALSDIYQELDKTKAKNELAGDRGINRVVGSSSLDDQSMQTHYKQAIWLWRSNTLNNSGNIVWDAETSNTQPNALIWDRHKSGIMAVQGGLYQISFGFFGTSTPSASLLLNDEPILTSKSLKSQEKLSGCFDHAHTIGNVTGLTCSEFLILPPKAKLSCRLKGAGSYEGFFLIKKI